MKHPNVNRKYNYQIYIQASAKVFAPITKLIITPTSHLKRTYPVCGNDFKASFVFTIYIYILGVPSGKCQRGEFVLWNVPIQIFAIYIYIYIYFHNFRGLKWIPL